jgi:hypothetical protein
MNPEKRDFNLAEGQLNILETYHRRLIRFLMYQLDDEFRLKPHEQADSAALGCALIELLKVSDARSFEMINQGILHSLLRNETHVNPYSARAMALAGMTSNKLFEEVLNLMRSDMENDGRISFGTEVLGEEGPLATCLSLDTLKRSGRDRDHTSLTEPALDYLAENVEALLQESPDTVARIVSVWHAFGSDLKKRGVENLVKRQGENGRWDESQAGLAADARVAGALIEAGEMEVAEQWLIQAFLLNHDGDLPEFPPFIEECRAALRPDLWIDAVLMTGLAAARYLAKARPDHNPAAYLLALSVPQENILVRAEEIIKLASPYLPPIDEVKDRGTQLAAFWDAGQPFDRSVFIMCGSTPSEKQEAATRAIADAVKSHDLEARFLAEGNVPYQSDPWDNAALYMTGCRYGIALLEGKIEVPPAELLYQTGFMRGQGSPLLVLWDTSVQDESSVAFPGVRSPMTGIHAMGYDPDVGPGPAIEQWIKSLREKKTGDE